MKTILRKYIYAFELLKPPEVPHEIGLNLRKCLSLFYWPGASAVVLTLEHQHLSAGMILFQHLAQSGVRTLTNTWLEVVLEHC